MEFYSGQPENPAASVRDYCTGVLSSAHDALAQNETEENEVRSLGCIERKRLAEVFCKVMPVSSHRHHALPMSL